MRWFRSHARLGSHVALFALALQLVLSFGHIHRKDVLGASAKSPAIAAFALDHADGAPPLPDGSRHPHEDGYCAIYAINGLIGCAQHVAPPTLQLPEALGKTLPPVTGEARLSGRHHIQSQARAPPIV